jgi:Putative adhesin
MLRDGQLEPGARGHAPVERPAGRPLGRRLLTGLLGAIGLLAATVVLLVLTRGDSSDGRTFPASVRRVVLEVESGNVTVTAREPAQIGVQRHRRWLLRPPTVEARQDGDVLRLVARCPPLSLDCSVHHVVALPRAVALSVRTGSGDVTVNGPRADVEVTTGSGDATVGDAQGRVRVSSGSGDLSLGLISGELVARTGSGDVQLLRDAGRVEVTTGSGDVIGDALAAPEFSARTGSGRLQVIFAAPVDRVQLTTSSGDVVVSVPRAAYRVEVATTSGSTRVSGIVQDQAAARVLRASTGSGDVVVTGR